MSDDKWREGIPGNWNPAQTANITLAKYLPSIGEKVYEGYCMYSFDSFTLAKLLRAVEEHVRGDERGRCTVEDGTASGNNPVPESIGG